jgi:ABC-type glycerol-3-phosphate transport system substrate-binding protein
MRNVRLIFGMVAAVLVGGCLSGPSGNGAAPGGGGTGGKLQLPFWHTRRGSQEKALQAICADYNGANPAVEVIPQFQGSYDDLNKKIRASILAKSLPALAVAYESHVSEYMANEAVRPLDDLVSDPADGLSKEELADIPEQYLASNRFKQFGDKLLSFPFTKSNLMLYYNRDLLKKAGFTAPPATWDEFEKQAAAITKQLGKPALAFDVDASTLDGLVYAHGGPVIADDQVHTLFDQPPTVHAFALLDRMRRAGSLVVAAPDDVAALFPGQMCAFSFNSSSARAAAEEQIGSKFDWDLTAIPHAQGVDPVTVMYGPNVCIFRATPEQEKAAWKFIKWFISPEVTARWARETGYLPVRKSAADLPEMKEFYEKNVRARHVYDVLPIARGEPNVVGWQEVRKLLEDAARSVLSGSAAPEAAAASLKKAADDTLAKSKS